MQFAGAFPILQGKYGDWFLSGFIESLQLLGWALLLALPLGLLLAVGRSATSRLARAPATAYVQFLRNIPVMVQLLFWYFAAPQLLPAFVRAALYRHGAEFPCAVLALGLYAAAFVSEDLLSGLRAIPRTQYEAASALGMGRWQSLRRVILPQALRNSLPALASQALTLWKNTSLATVIGASELMYQTQKVETESFRGAEAFAVATVLYLAVSTLITGLGVVAERWRPVHAR